MKLNTFLKQTPSIIETNAFSIRVAPLWFANMNIQFILDAYAIASYCISYMTKNDKFVTSKIAFNNRKRDFR
jgi:hypothetical protein